MNRPWPGLAGVILLLLSARAMSTSALPPPADPRISASAAYAEGEWMMIGGRGQKLPTRLADILQA